MRREKGMKLAEEMGIKFFETSAMTNFNVDFVFERLAVAVLE